MNKNLSVNKMSILEFANMLIEADAKNPIKDIADMRAAKIRCNVIHDMTAGKTAIIIPFESSEVYAQAECHIKDIYNKKYGRLIAMARLLDNLLGGNRVKNTIEKIEKEKADAKVFAKNKRLSCMIKHTMNHYGVNREAAIGIILDRKENAALDKARAEIEAARKSLRAELVSADKE